MSARTPATPHLVVEVSRLEANLAAMSAFARHHGVSLRPHAKTHKTGAVARRQLAHGAHGLTVATLSEAEVFADAGCTDLFVAYPLWVTLSQGERIRRLVERARLIVGVESHEGVRALADHVGPHPDLVVRVEVDSGQHRTGVAPDRAGALAEAAASLGLQVEGVFTFPGHGYQPGAPHGVAAQEQAALSESVESLAEHGISAHVVSGGSTPTVESMQPGVLSEVRPGVYVFGDAQQWELGTVGPERLALTCRATVVSVHGDRVVLDAGSKALGADRAPWSTGFGRLATDPAARITALSEHHAVVAWGSAPRPSPGDLVDVVPNHVCSAVNLAERLFLEVDGELAGTWTVDGRGALT